MTKIAKALELVAQGVNPHAAAKASELAPSVVYNELKKRRLKEQGICPCCGQPLKNSLQSGDKQV